MLNKSWKKYHRLFLIWRLKTVSTRNFLLIIAALVGIFSGLAAVLLKFSVHEIETFLKRDFNVEFENYFYLGYPLIGIVLTAVISHVIFKETMGHGITHILYDISKRYGVIAKTKMYSRLITSAITVGFGGSVGLESPIVVTGSAIGSNFSLFAHLDARKRNVMIGCGAAGAISAIFNSPVAGVIFAMEVILSETRISTFIPLLIASVAGSLMSMVFLGDDVLFSFKLVDKFTAGEMPYYFLIGIITGLASVYFTRTTYFIESKIRKINNYFYRALLGGLSLGIIIFLFPPIYGEGYNTIKLLLADKPFEVLNTSLFFTETNNITLLFLFIFGVTLIKPIASALTIGSGGSGGIFGPSLFLGGFTGFLFSALVNELNGETIISTSNFTLVGMCGAMSGILHAPLTAIFLIAEITSGYDLFVPLMFVSAVSFATTSIFEKNSLYTKHLVEKGDLIPYDKDRQVLSQMNIAKLVEKDLLTVHPDAKLKELVNLVKKSHRNIFPVVNDQGNLLGIITLDDIRQIMFDPMSQEEIKVNTLMNSPPTSVSTHENMQSVMVKFEKTNAWNLPVIDNGVYKGFLSKSRIFNTYRTKLILQHKE